MEPIPIVFATNDNHAMLLGVALCSLFENKKGDYPIRICVLDGGISLTNKERLKILEERYHFAISYLVPDKKWFAGIARGERSIAAYYRVAIGHLLPAEYKKAIYMDCDIIIRGDLDKLFGIDLESRTIGAVPDVPQDWWRAHIKKVCSELSIKTSEATSYFNSGVLLMDLARWREEKVGEKLLQFIKEHPDRLWVADQDPLNIIFLDRWKQLSPRYNFITAHAALLASEKDPLIVHFAGGAKPWYRFSALPYQPEYVYYANKTPWAKEKYRKLVDVPFAKKYRFYSLIWPVWEQYKKFRKHS